jgi:hypothetical protein
MLLLRRLDAWCERIAFNSIQGRRVAPPELEACRIKTVILTTQLHFASRELILGISVLLEAGRAFQMPTTLQALTPQLVPQDMLQSAMALSSSGMQVSAVNSMVIGASNQLG